MLNATEDIRPNYYRSCGEIGRKLMSRWLPGSLLDCECLDTIGVLGDDFYLGSALKYLWRAGEKPDIPVLEDLIKARFYLQQYLFKNQNVSRYAAEAIKATLKNIEQEIQSAS